MGIYDQIMILYVKSDDCLSGQISVFKLAASKSNIDERIKISSISIISF